LIGLRAVLVLVLIFVNENNMSARYRFGRIGRTSFCALRRTFYKLHWFVEASRQASGRRLEVRGDNC